METCYHCHETVPPGTDYSLVQDGELRRFCCPGCRAVAQLIADQGLERFYRFRTAPGQKPPEHDDLKRAWSVCDRPEVSSRLAKSVGDGMSELRFTVGGINCAACTWLIGRGVGAIEGIDDVSINPVTHEALVRFDPGKVRISRIMEAVESLGFMPRPGIRGMSAANARESRDELKRLAVAGLGFAQVMTLSAALYLGAFKTMEASFTSFFVVASMLVATPVVLYAGAPIFRGAFVSLAGRRLGMDVPVSLAILVALGASLVNAFRGVGHVYFDSATMFVFFLTLGRFLESRARYRAGGVIAALAEVRPLAATRRKGGIDERVGTVELVPGDIVVVAPGEPVPADGALVSESAQLDESLLSGEAQARHRGRGESVLGGSLNLGRSPLEVRVVQSGGDGYIDRVGDLLHRAMSDRPEFLRLADRWAGYFVAAVLVLTVLVGSFWFRIDDSRTVEVVLAMLVVTCPCALSLAAPTAFSVALGKLARLGLLCRTARVIERVGEVRTWLFDKTGTLTEGRIGIVAVEPFGQLSESRCIEIAAALETGIEHPLARAFRRISDSAAAADVEYAEGLGVSGRVEGERYLIGSARFVGLNESDIPATAASRADDAPSLWLAGEQGVIARFVLADRIRLHASDAIESLGRSAQVELVSGDALPVVADVARMLGIAKYQAGLLPSDKLELLRARQQGGEVVAAVGDGINDAPFLAQADVSIAMVAGSELAKASADIVFTGDDLRILARLPGLAAATRRVVRQNLGWAVAYNLTVVPLAASGVLMPWMAALGMSLSSLLVTANALRLGWLLSESMTESTTTPEPLEMGERSA